MKLNPYRIIKHFSRFSINTHDVEWCSIEQRTGEEIEN